MKQSAKDYTRAIGLLVARIGFGVLLLLLHGWEKVANFSSLSDSFPDPVGLGSTGTLIVVAIVQVGCAGAVAVGLFTRITAIPCALVMFGAAFIEMSSESWAGEREAALLYMIGFTAIALLGGGPFSVDSFRKNK